VSHWVARRVPCGIYKRKYLIDFQHRRLIYTAYDGKCDGEIGLAAVGSVICDSGPELTTVYNLVSRHTTIQRLHGGHLLLMKEYDNTFCTVFNTVTFTESNLSILYCRISKSTGGCRQVCVTEVRADFFVYMGCIFCCTSTVIGQYK
jgi:hypothetical protein